ncbi:N-acetylglucosamine-6-phosphate deacetylase [Azospirillum sp. YIM DDC1]|uniref:N-acetylglucosamine-6-phosphate deacetylase n=1 Tax=Azospirillum aestuarii TaxID=2802052 RepID=A0ABS1I2B8_9PROT|nr:N-acetylglucosamine-6-phosphate deacetylase [Azospirillum aestuarii]MBK4721224.1 N-acetylglucosamine-6-phosphate deacetylase [Azospirillum aestuarii]
MSHAHSPAADRPLKALVNATLHTGDSVLAGAALLLDGPAIAAIIAPEAIPPEAEVTDLGGGILAPGFIDLQVNGGGGALFNDTPDLPTLRRIAEAHRRFGTTGLLPTLITDSAETRAAAVAAVRAGMAQGMPGLLGIHLEGPHIAPERRGVHDARFIAPPDAGDLALLGGLSGLPALVTLAPEAVPPEQIRRLAAAGLRIAAGHSAATWAQAKAGFAAGITGVTHLFNAMSPLGSREPGMVGAALEEDGVWCGIIVDGHHVHDASVRLAWKAKARGRLFLVTDAMPPVGATQPGATEPGATQPGGFQLYGEDIRVEDGRCVTADGTLAGSALDMATAVRNAVERVGIPLDEALRMASAYPADFMGMAGRRGRIRPGLAADLVHLDERLRVRATWISGKMAVS